MPAWSGIADAGADIAILHLRPHHPYPYVAGQYATLMSPRLPRVWRPYTMATAAGNQDLLEFHVRALGGGGLSDVLVNATAPGDVLRLGPPQGTSTLRGAGGRSRLFVASGVGWAPTKALLDQLAQSAAAGPYPPPARLVHIGPAGLLYDPDLARLPDRCPWLSTAYVHTCDDVIDCPARGRPAGPARHLHQRGAGRRRVGRRGGRRGRRALRADPRHVVAGRLIDHPRPRAFRSVVTSSARAAKWQLKRFVREHPAWPAAAKL
jgi:hypothetical protein